MIKIDKSSNYFSALPENHTKVVDFWNYSSARISPILNTNNKCSLQVISNLHILCSLSLSLSLSLSSLQAKFFFFFATFFSRSLNSFV